MKYAFATLMAVDPICLCHETATIRDCSGVPIITGAMDGITLATGSVPPNVVGASLKFLSIPPGFHGFFVLRRVNKSGVTQLIHFSVECTKPSFEGRKSMTDPLDQEALGFHQVHVRPISSEMGERLRTAQMVKPGVVSIVVHVVERLDVAGKQPNAASMNP
jgi:hypothetical protein